MTYFLTICRVIVDSPWDPALYLSSGLLYFSYKKFRIYCFTLSQDQQAGTEGHLCTNST